MEMMNFSQIDCNVPYTSLVFLKFHYLAHYKSPIIIDGNLLNVGVNVFLMKTVDIVLSVLKMIFSL